MMYGLLKLTATGNMVWNKTYGGIGDDNLFAYSGLIQTSDGGYAMSAATTSYGAGNQRLLANKNRFIWKYAI